MSNHFVNHTNSFQDAKRPNKIIENLVLPIAINLGQRLSLGKTAANQLKKSLSEMTPNRGEDMSEDIKQQMVTHINASDYYVVKLDESTN